MNLQLDDWKDLEPEPKKVAAAPVRFGVVSYRGGPRRGKLLIKRDVVHGLQMQNWRVNVRLSSEYFRLAVVPSLEGKFELQEVGVSKGGGTFRLTLPAIDSWTDYPCPMAEADWMIEKIAGKQKALIINLPPPLVSKPKYQQWERARA